MQTPSQLRNENVVLITSCVLVWLVCAIYPADLEAWLLEQVAPLLGIACLYYFIRVGRPVQFSLQSRICMALLFIAHTIGTHFTYSLTPYNEWSGFVFGSSINEWFGWERNHYDRFVHLFYGLSLAIPLQEVFQQRLNTLRMTARILALNILLSTSALYELLEWFAAELFGGELGAAYLGTQGDIWDAHADIALAGLGGLLVYIAQSVYSRSQASLMLSKPSDSSPYKNNHI